MIENSRYQVVHELESGKPFAPIAHETGIHLSLPSQWKEIQISGANCGTGVNARPASCRERTFKKSLRHGEKEG
jgi:hypothetical protein